MGPVPCNVLGPKAEGTQSCIGYLLGGVFPKANVSIKNGAKNVMKLPSLAPESKALLLAGVACCIGGLRMTHLVLWPDREETSLWFLFGLLSVFLFPMNKGNREGFGPLLIWACFSGCLLSAISTGNGGRITYLLFTICLLVFVFLAYYAFASHRRAERHETGSNEK